MTSLRAMSRIQGDVLTALFLAASMVLGGGVPAAQENPSGASNASPPPAAGPAGATAPDVSSPDQGGMPAGEEEAPKKNDGEESETKKKKNKTGFVGIPIPIANPTLQQGLALVGAALYNLGEDAPASLTGAGAMYTSTQSWGYGLIQKVYTSHDRWRITAGAVRFKLNLRFYGIGVDPGPNDPYLSYALDGKAYGAQVLRSLGKHVYMGIGYTYFSNTTTFDFKNNLPEVPFGDLTFRQSVATLSLPIQWDTRDNLLNPKRGDYLTFSALFSDPDVGSDYTYQQYRLGYNHYAHLNDRMVLAVRGTTCDTRGRAPFYLICALGTGDALRGFAADVYRDKATATALAEWRWNFAGRWGIVAFAGAGTMASSLTDLNLDTVIPSYGLGIRFLMERDYGVNIGIDYGRSKNRDAIYFRVGESF